MNLFKTFGLKKADDKYTDEWFAMVQKLLESTDDMSNDEMDEAVAFLTDEDWAKIDERMGNTSLEDELREAMKDAVPPPNPWESAQVQEDLRGDTKDVSDEEEKSDKPKRSFAVDEATKILDPDNMRDTEIRDKITEQTGLPPDQVNLTGLTEEQLQAIYDMFNMSPEESKKADEEFDAKVDYQEKHGYTPQDAKEAMDYGVSNPIERRHPLHPTDRSFRPWEFDFREDWENGHGPNPNFPDKTAAGQQAQVMNVLNPENPEWGSLADVFEGKYGGNRPIKGSKGPPSMNPEENPGMQNMRKMDLFKMFGLKKASGITDVSSQNPGDGSNVELGGGKHRPSSQQEDVHNPSEGTDPATEEEEEENGDGE